MIDKHKVKASPAKPIITKAMQQMSVVKPRLTKAGKNKGTGGRKAIVPKKVGRPSKYEGSVDKICEDIAEGKSLVTILKKKGMPSYTRVMVWLQENEGFRDRYARARADQADFLADEILAISDKATKAKDNVTIQAARLRIDTRKWVASKLKPKKYGERVAHAGDEAVPLLNKSIEIIFVDPDVTDEG